MAILSIRTTIFALALVAVLAAAYPARAAIYTVTTTADTGPGSLRQALLDANATAATADEIHFAIPDAGPHEIRPASQLPFVTSTLTIDGYTQPGASANTLTTSAGALNTVLRISLIGVSGIGLIVTPANGVTLTVQGLNLQGYTYALRGPDQAGSSELRSFGNFLGTNINGSAAGAGTTDCIRGGNGGIVIGGEAAWQRNLISACRSGGIVISGRAVVQGNLIGTDASGTVALGNGSFSNWGGIYVLNVTAPIQIGGANAGARNVVSGNSRTGILINRNVAAGAYANLSIHGNYIGTDWSGSAPLPNGTGTAATAPFNGGIRIIAPSNMTDTTPLIIGGNLPGQGNRIAYNNGSGISANQNFVAEAFDSRGNTLFGNTFGGATNIDIGAFGRTANDPGDGDGGANSGQNHPEIISVSESGGVATVRYRVDTLPANALYPLRIDFYRGFMDGASGELMAQDSYPEGQATLEREFSFVLPVGERAWPLVATASSDGRTSELSSIPEVLFADSFGGNP